MMSYTDPVSWSRLTAKKFLAAANFLELLSIFGEINSEVRLLVRGSAPPFKADAMHCT